MLKKYGFLIFMSLVVIALIVAAMNKDKLYALIGDKIQEQNDTTTVFEAEKYVHDHFNYTQNKEAFEFTLLQFKSQGCTICKEMEPVLAEIKQWKNPVVNVQVIQVMNPDSQELMKYYGVSAVPMHIILDKSGKEIFRNYGFIPADELKAKFTSKK